MTPLSIVLAKDGRSARLLKPYTAIVNHLHISVPLGFRTDFASVPRFFWRLLPPWGDYSEAAVVHDYLYATGMVSKAVADRAFLLLMKYHGVARWKRQLLYWGVRLFGGLAWRAWRKNPLQD